MLNTQLSLLESRGLVALSAADPELEYAFRHPLLYEAAYASLTRADRRSLHLAVGETLEALYPDRLEELAPRLADHFSQAGDPTRALHYYCLAGKAAQRVYANAEAALHYRQALELIPSGATVTAIPLDDLIDLYLRLGRVLELSGNYEEALAHYRAMEAEAVRQGSRPLELAALIARGTVQSTPTVLFNAEEAAPTSERALALAQELGDRTAQAKIYWTMLLQNVFSRSPEKALEYGERSLAIAREDGLREQLAYTLNDMGSFVYFALGEREKSLQASMEAGAIWREFGNLPMLADSTTNIAVNEFVSGNFKHSLEMSRQANQIAASIGNLWGQAYSLGVQAYVYAHQGLADLALPILDESFRLGGPSGFTAVLNISLIVKGFLYAILGDRPDGMQAAWEGIRIGRSGFDIWSALLYAVQAYFQILEGRLDEAEASLNATSVTGYEAELILYTPIYMMALAEMHLARHSYSALIDFMTSHLERLGNYQAWTFMPYGQLYLGRAYHAAEKIPEARDSYQEAIRLADELEIYPVEWQARARLADLEQAQRNPEEAARLRQDARRPAQMILDHAGVPEIKAAFLALPDVQKVIGGAAA